MSHRFPSLPNIESLIDGDGEITIGRAGPIHCAATASYEYDALVMLVRRDGETLEQLLMRLDTAIDKAAEEGILIDEFNNESADSIR